MRFRPVKMKGVLDMHGMTRIFTKEKTDKVQTITTLEIAEMMDTPHYEILRKLEGTTNADGSTKQTGIIPVLTDGKIPVSDYFSLSTYKDASGRENRCYNVTKLGCDFLANKFTGEKGILFTARYVKRFDEMENHIKEEQKPSLETVNETVKIFTDLMQRAGCSAEIQLLTVKTIIENNTGMTLPAMIQADKQYYDTEYIARKVGICVKSSGKPAEKAVNEIMRRLNISEDMYTETWETNGKWQGTVRKYTDDVIKMVLNWCKENGYPSDIEYIQSDGQKKKYHVKWKEVA